MSSHVSHWRVMQENWSALKSACEECKCAEKVEVEYNVCGALACDWCYACGLSSYKACEMVI